MATDTNDTENRIDQETPIRVYRAADPSAVTVGFRPDVARLLSNACLARAEYYAAYDAPQSAYSLDGIATTLVDGKPGRQVKLGIVHLEAIADAAAWHAHEMFRVGAPSPSHIEQVQEASDAVRDTLEELRNAFQLCERDQLAARVEASR